MNRLRLSAAFLLTAATLVMSAEAPDFKSYVIPEFDEASDTGTYPSYDTFLTGSMADAGVGVLTFIYQGATIALNSDCKEPAKLLMVGDENPLAELTTDMLFKGSFWDPAIDFAPQNKFVRFIFRNYYSGDPEQVINQPGAYQAIIPAGFFTINGELSGESVFNYYIGAGNYVPADETTIDLGFRNEYTTDEGWSGLRFEPFANIYVNTAIAGVTEGCKENVVVIDDNLNIYATVPVSAVTMQEVNGNRTYSIPFEKALSQTGEYYVNMPAGFWRLGEAEVVALSPNIVLNYTVSMSKKVIYTTDNNEVKGNFDSLLFTVNGEIQEVDNNLKVTIRKNTSIATLGEFNLTLTENKRGFILTPAEAMNLESGKYLLTLPAGLITISVDGEPVKSDLTNLLFQLDTTLGVNSVEQTAGLVTVISATGVTVLRDADASMLKTLAPGFYIVNGKKTIIR